MFNVFKVGIVVVVMSFLSSCASTGMTPKAWSNKNYCTPQAAYAQGKQDAMSANGIYDRSYASWCFTRENELNTMYAVGYSYGLTLHPYNVPASQPLPDFEKERKIIAVTNFFQAMLFVASNS